MRHLKGKVSRISLVVLSPNDFEPLERFVWDVSSFPMVPTAEQHTPFQSHEDPTALSGATLADIEEQLRASLGKISLASAKLSKLPQECTFTISIELKGDAPAPVGVSRLSYTPRMTSDMMSSTRAHGCPVRKDRFQRPVRRPHW